MADGRLPGYRLDQSQNPCDGRAIVANAVGRQHIQTEDADGTFLVIQLPKRQPIVPLKLDFAGQDGEHDADLVAETQSDDKIRP